MLNLVQGVRLSINHVASVVEKVVSRYIIGGGATFNQAMNHQHIVRIDEECLPFVLLYCVKRDFLQL